MFFFAVKTEFEIGRKFRGTLRWLKSKSWFRKLQKIFPEFFFRLPWGDLAQKVLCLRSEAKPLGHDIPTNQFFKIII